ncbi:MAG: Sec-independent protein translocase protein TatB [Acidobacteriota bacterium]
MFLFIFESIGTSELMLIALVALIFLGPRKMPEYAKKIGKLMNEFRSTTNEFKETWEREVNFDEEVKAFRTDDEAAPAPVARIEAIAGPSSHDGNSDAISAPSITEVDPAVFKPQNPADIDGPRTTAADPDTADDINDKKNWL